MASVKRFNWIREPTTWQRIQQRRESNAKLSQQFLDTTSAASTKFASAQIDQTAGIASIAAKIANQRVQSQASASRNQLNSLLGSINTLA
jgi:hypothetical protein